MNRFINDIKKYYKFAVYSAKSDLKSEIANSHLSWLWWILDPLLFMLVYTFIAEIVFNRSQPYFPIYVFIGLTSWTFFDKSLKNSVKLVTSNRAIVAKVYLPKFILIMSRLLVNGFKMAVSFSLVIIMMVFSRVPLTPKILLVVPIFLVLIVLTFGCSTILLHFGVFVEDLSNIIQVLLRLLFYLSGIFYALDRLKNIPHPFDQLIITCNPMALILLSLRQTMLYETIPNLLALGIWFLIGIVLSVIGVYTIYRYENSYVKVI